MPVMPVCQAHRTFMLRCAKMRRCHETGHFVAGAPVNSKLTIEIESDSIPYVFDESVATAIPFADLRR
jgi:hypothetical protein